MRRSTGIRTALSAAATFALVVTATLVAAAPPAAAAAIAIEDVPYAMDTSNQAGWWQPIAETSAGTFLAFNAPSEDENTHEVHVGLRDPAGGWSAGCLQLLTAADQRDAVAAPPEGGDTHDARRREEGERGIARLLGPDEIERGGVALRRGVAGTFEQAFAVGDRRGAELDQPVVVVLARGQAAAPATIRPAACPNRVRWASG